MISPLLCARQHVFRPVKSQPVEASSPSILYSRRFIVRWVNVRPILTSFSYYALHRVVGATFVDVTRKGGSNARYDRKLILTRGNDRGTCRFAARHAILAQPKTETWSSPWKSPSCWWTKQSTRFAPGVSSFHFPWYRHLPDAPLVSWSLEQTSSLSSCRFFPAGTANDTCGPFTMKLWHWNS